MASRASASPVLVLRRGSEAARDAVLDDAWTLLQVHGATLSAEYRHGLQLAVANGLLELNRREAAAEYVALLADSSLAAATKT